MSTEIDGVNGIIKNTTSDGDVTIKGNDGGSEVSALILDMSDAGTATFNHDVKLGDNSKALFGAGSDLQIYHDGSTSYIDDNGTGDFDIRTNGAKLSLKRVADGHEGLRYTPGGSLLIKHNNSTKLETTSAGVDITGAFTATAASTITTADNTDTLTLISTDADAASGPNLRLRRDSSSPADDDDLGHIFFSGEDAAGNETNYITFDVITKTVADGSENGLLQIKTMSAGTLLELAAFQADGIVFNERSNDLNFRVESNDNASMLFVDAGNNRVGIGEAAPASALHITTGDLGTLPSLQADADDVVIENSTPGITLMGATDGGGMLAFGDTADADIGRIFYYHVDNSMSFTAGTNAVMKLKADSVVVNEDSDDVDFRVESNDNTHQLFVDGGNNHVFIGSDSTTDFGGSLNVKDNSQTGIFCSSGSGSQQNMILTNTAGSFNSRMSTFQALRNSTAHFEFSRFLSNDGNDVEHLFDGAGAIKIDGVVTTGGIDYAEYFEWKDGNSSSEDRRGHSVITDGNKIVVATSSDDASKIIGIVSTNPTVLGDADLERWMFKYERDDYGSLVWEEHTVTEWTDEDGKDHSYNTDRIPSDVTAPSDATVISEEKDRYGNTIKLKRKKLNSSWDSSKNYISREDRKEWEAIGLVGKLRLKKGEPTNPNWIKLRDISETVEEWLVR
jgi:hypothetical protein